MHFSTNTIHAGLKYSQETGAVIPPIYSTSTFATGNREGFDYTRSGNPNFLNLESVLATIENGKYATVFASGVSAITAVISTLSSGDVILAEENIYGCTYRLFDQVFKKFGIEVEYLDFTDLKSIDQLHQKKPALVWIESPTNPLLKIIDIKRVAEHCKQCTSTLVVDNTFASPYFQKPLELGADVSLSSTTKYTNGHSDSLGGAVITNNKEWEEKMKFAQKSLGLQPSPHDTWLISRGVKTLEVRMKQHAKNALAIGEFLESHPKICNVRYPFLPSHPQYELAIRQMSGGSGIITADFDVPQKELQKENLASHTLSFLKRLKLFTLAESLGGIESLCCHPASMTHASIPEEEQKKVGITGGTFRLSVGIESVEDLIADLNDALL
jgi:cystathionine gamma-synthase